MTLLGSWIPFGKVGKVLHTLLGIELSEATARRCTERYGQAYEAVQSAAVGKPETPEFNAWLQTNLHTLKQEGICGLLPELQMRVTQHPEDPDLAEALAYLEKRVGMMDYPEYQRQGWPIGSGSVESANKVVVEARLKGAGMHWAPAHVNPMLSLRNAVCNDRWDEAWASITMQYRIHQRQRFLERAGCNTVVPLPPPLRVAAAEPIKPLPSADTATPPPKQPWRRSLGPLPRRHLRPAEI